MNTRRKPVPPRLERRHKVAAPPPPPPASEAPRKQRHARERVFVTADEWVARLAALDRMNAADRKQFTASKRLEIDLTERRMQALAVVRETFGPGEAGWRACQEAGGCSWWTYRDWEDRTKNVQPRSQSFERTAVAARRSGWRYGFYQP